MRSGHTVAPSGCGGHGGRLDGCSDRMLSIGKLANGQADYYLSLAGARVDRSASVSSGVEGYCVGGAEPPGRWRGERARELGLDGQVSASKLNEVLEVDGAGLPELMGRRT